MKTLFLAWQAPADAAHSRAWFPVGRLDAEPEHYRFQYIGGAKRAHDVVGFEPLLAFPDFNKVYESVELF
ncbi:MAG: DNA-binding protein, partial [bacterium]